MSALDSVPLLSTFLTCLHLLRLYKIRYFTSGHSLHLDSILLSVWYTFPPPHIGICSYSTFTHMNSDSEIFRFALKQLNYNEHLFKLYSKLTKYKYCRFGGQPGRTVHLKGEGGTMLA